MVDRGRAIQMLREVKAVVTRVENSPEIEAFSTEEPDANGKLPGIIVLKAGIECLTALAEIKELLESESWED